MDIGGAGNSGNLGGSGSMHPQIVLKSRTPEIRFPASWEVIFYRKARHKRVGNELIGIELNSESEIACSMCARSLLSASLGSFIFFNKSELDSHFSSLSVLLCLIQIRNYWGGGLKPPQSPRFRRPCHHCNSLVGTTL